MNIQKVNCSQEIVDYPCLETDYVIEILNKFVNNKDYLELVKNIEKINVLISFRGKEPIFLLTKIKERRRDFVRIDFFYKNDKEKYTMILNFNPVFFERPDFYTETEKKYLYNNIINEVSLFLKNIQKYQETEQEKEIRNTYLVNLM